MKTNRKPMTEEARAVQDLMRAKNELRRAERIREMRKQAARIRAEVQRVNRPTVSPEAMDRYRSIPVGHPHE